MPDAHPTHDEPTDRDGLPRSLSDRLGYLLGQAHLTHRSIAAPLLATLGLGVKEFGALAVVNDEGPLSQQRLGERLRVDRTTMVAVVDQLERQGFVERQRNPEDRRAYSLRVTERGQRVLRQAAEAAEQAEAAFLTPLPARDRGALKDALRLLLR